MAFDSKGTLNKVMAIGRLGSDVELKYTPSGAAVATLSLATNTSWKGQDGSMNENTEWIRCVVWRKTAEAVEKYAKKGDRIYIEGKLQTRDWEDKDGNKRYTTEVQVDTVQFLSDSRKSESSAENVPEQPDLGTDENNDPLPF